MVAIKSLLSGFLLTLLASAASAQQGTAPADSEIRIGNLMPYTGALAAFPWTMGWQPAFRAEGRIFANYIQAAYANRKIAVLWENDQFGRVLFQGLREGLGDTAGLIVADIAFDIADNSVDGQIEILKDS